MALAPVASHASSHREAPLIGGDPRADNTDTYAFVSPDKPDTVSLVANWIPFEEPNGGPNFYPFAQNTHYDIRIDNTGDAVEDLTFRFRFTNLLVGLGVPVPLPTGVFVPVGISNVFPAGPGSPPPNPPFPPNDQRINWVRFYTVRLLRGPADHPTEVDVFKGPSGAFFAMPFDYIGERSFPDYPAYARQFVYPATIPTCGAARVFVGQRKDPFAVNLGDFFDLVNIPNPIGPRAAEPNSLANKNITALVLEVPIACLKGSGSGVIGGWTTASLKRVRTLVDTPTFDHPYEEAGNYVQVSRLGNPLVNEISIGMKDKNLFNASRPKDDAQFALYFTHPTVPVGIQLVTTLFPPPVGTVQPPTNIPRSDLVAFYLQGLAGLNHDGSGGEVLRLNTATPPVPAATQNNLGYLGGDSAGWPNGRRPGDDVVDVTIRVLEGALCYQAGLGLCHPTDAPFGFAPFTDQTWVDATQFDSAFPYLTTPIPGAPNPQRVFNARLAGAGSASGACSALLPPVADPFAPPANPTGLSIVCTHDLGGSPGADLRLGAGGTVVCDLGTGASPIQITCPLDPAQLQELQQGQLVVTVGGLTGTLQ